MTTENTLAQPSIKVSVDFIDSEDLDNILEFCKERFGHRGKEAGWWWRINGKWKNKKAVFTFKKEEDAVAFKLSKGAICKVK